MCQQGPQRVPLGKKGAGLTEPEPRPKGFAAISPERCELGKTEEKKLTVKALASFRDINVGSIVIAFCDLSCSGGHYISAGEIGTVVDMSGVGVVRMFRAFAVGDRVVASLDLHYGTGEFVPEGGLGTIAAESRVSGLTFVRWDDHPHAELQTAVDNIDPAKESQP